MPTPLRAGMTLTDEPGLYLAGKFGVRIENTVLISDYMSTAVSYTHLFAPIVANNGVEETLDRVKQVVHMMKDRVNFVYELWPLCSFFLDVYKRQVLSLHSFWLQ